MDRSTLDSITRFSTSSRSLVRALCDTGAKLGPWPANSSSPRTGTGRPPRASSCQADTEPSEPKVQLSRTRMTPPGWCGREKVAHFKLSAAEVSQTLLSSGWEEKLFGHCPSPFWGENPVIWALLCPVFSWGYWDHAALLLSLGNSGVVTLWTGKEIPGVQEYPIKQH